MEGALAGGWIHLWRVRGRKMGAKSRGLAMGHGTRDKWQRQFNVCTNEAAEAVTNCLSHVETPSRMENFLSPSLIYCSYKVHLHREDDESWC